MKYTLNKKTINIPDKDIENFKNKYSLSKEDAIKLWLEDNDYLENETVNALVEKTKGQRHYERAEKTNKKSPTKERKVDTEKAFLLALLKKSLENEVSIGETKNEAEFAFTLGENNYTVKLIKHRPKNAGAT